MKLVSLIKKYIYLTPLLVFLFFIYGIFSGEFSKNFKIKQESNRVYSDITKYIDSINEEYRQFGGRVDNGYFTVEISFKQISIFRLEDVLDKIKDMGYTEKKKEGSYILLCNGRSGIDVRNGQKIKISFKYSDKECHNYSRLEGNR